jgi:hypothetical protein
VVSFFLRSYTEKFTVPDPAVSLSIYSHAQRDDLRAAGAALFS